MRGDCIIDFDIKPPLKKNHEVPMLYIFLMVELRAVFTNEINIIDADSILVDIQSRIKFFCTSRTDPVTEYELRMLG